MTSFVLSIILIAVLELGKIYKSVTGLYGSQKKKVLYEP
jgi:hypothetical protein